MPRFPKSFLAFIAGLVINEAMAIIGYILVANFFESRLRSFSR